MDLILKTGRAGNTTGFPLFRGLMVLLLAWASPPGTLKALTPLPDGSAAFFAGEWMGSGEHGATCYLSLNVDGSGTALVDAGAGDWLGARFQWQNDRQSLRIVKTVPLIAAPRYRLGPLTTYTLSAGMNQSLRLSWNGQTCGCQLQKIETTARHLARAREALKALESPDNRR